MSISFGCPNWHHALKSPDEYAGKMARCKACGTKITIPTPGNVPAAPCQQTTASQTQLHAPLSVEGLKGRIGRLTRKAREHLDPGETLMAVIIGSYVTKVLGAEMARPGVLLATDRRLLFFAKKILGFDLEVFPYSNVSSFEMSKGLMGYSISFFASNNKAKMKWFNAGDVQIFAQVVKERMGRKESAAPNGGQTDIADQLVKLGQLRESGVLTASEFEQKKKELLARM